MQTTTAAPLQTLPPLQPFNGADTVPTVPTLPPYDPQPMTTMAPDPISQATPTATPTAPPTTTAMPLVEGKERKGLSAVEIGVITVAIAISIVLIGIILALQRPLA